jgi:hypothetical protein
MQADNHPQQARTSGQVLLATALTSIFDFYKKLHTDRVKLQVQATAWLKLVANHKRPQNYNNIHQPDQYLAGSDPAITAERIAASKVRHEAALDEKFRVRREDNYADIARLTTELEPYLIEGFVTDKLRAYFTHYDPSIQPTLEQLATTCEQFLYKKGALLTQLNTAAEKRAAAETKADQARLACQPAPPLPQPPLPAIVPVPPPFVGGPAMMEVDGNGGRLPRIERPEIDHYAVRDTNINNTNMTIIAVEALRSEQAILLARVATAETALNDMRRQTGNNNRRPRQQQQPNNNPNSNNRYNRQQQQQQQPNPNSNPNPPNGHGSARSVRRSVSTTATGRGKGRGRQQAQAQAHALPSQQRSPSQAPRNRPQARGRSISRGPPPNRNGHGAERQGPRHTHRSPSRDRRTDSGQASRTSHTNRGRTPSRRGQRRA